MSDTDPAKRGRLLTVSPSRLALWLDCPKAYRMRYLDRPRPPMPPQRAVVSIGNSAHAALSRFWDLQPHDRTPDGVQGLLGEVWQESGFEGVEQSRWWRRRVAMWLVDYLRGVDRDRDPMAVERTVALPTATLAISGRVDRVEERDGELVVIDYKTSANPPEPHAARTSLALGLYALALSRMFRRPVRRVELHHLPTRSHVAHRHTEISLQRKLVEAESIGEDLIAAHTDFDAHGLGAASFEARPSALCRWCPVQQSCEQGRQVGPAMSGSAGLDRLAAAGAQSAEEAPD
ncbi:MAG TPA: PD-(D/E)XK nuclease family protein [Ornithinimicrobium sp.]|uniref:RecB family exonuclease n=1 Tax=Ornithinimicrobium sp. TaxID=1977084 RepID=UPI002B477BEF|nr:PD-(D/E)XK nuclease family protein [Ornithinimicrobium sp.]HKJ11834.1 PD-(D/E)XK nuclease family protein [Ornithinimicrobium sp.]